MTLRGWERRYGFPRPMRTGSGYRTYSDEDLQAILAVKEQIARGIATSDAIAMVRAGKVASRPSPKELIDQFLRAAETMAEVELEQTSSLAETLLEPVQFGREFALPALRLSAERLDVAREHLASAVIRAHLRRAIERIGPRSDWKGVYVLACPSGEEHEGGLLATALELRVLGRRTVTLGANTPAEAVASAVRQTEADGVGLSLVSLNEGELARLLREIVVACAPVPVVAGGPLARRHLRLVYEAGANFAESVEELVSVVERADA